MNNFKLETKISNWFNSIKMAPLSFQCGHCNNKVSSERGFHGSYNSDGSGSPIVKAHICPECKALNYFDKYSKQFPTPMDGQSINGLSDDIASLYSEARACASIGASTASVMVCRKILMNIAVEKGAKSGENFLTYIEYLANNGYIPPNGKSWVDYIRTKGNEANHEIKLMESQDATALIKFVEMLLRFSYEFPSLVPLPSTKV